MPLLVFLVIEGRERVHPKPNGPFPDPESYVSESDGPNPDRPGLVKIGTLRDPVPFTGVAVNFSPIPRIAPPPFGSDIEGIVNPLFLLLEDCSCCSCLLVLAHAAGALPG